MVYQLLLLLNLHYYTLYGVIEVGFWPEDQWDYSPEADWLYSGDTGPETFCIRYDKIIRGEEL